MVIGIGIDTIELERLRRTIDQYQDAFLCRIYTEREIEIANRRKPSVFFYGGRWAAKEALVKALGVGIGKECRWLDMEILNDTLGKPLVHFQGNARITLHKMGNPVIHISITHEKNLASAVAIIEKRTAK